MKYESELRNHYVRAVSRKLKQSVLKKSVNDGEFLVDVTSELCVNFWQNQLF